MNPPPSGDGPVPDPPPGAVTALLERIRTGDEAARNELFVLVEADLNAAARQRLIREHAGHTLQPTALVHECFVRLVTHDAVRLPQNHRAFRGLAGVAMSRILIDHARRRASRRKAEAAREPWDDVQDEVERGLGFGVSDLNRVLEDLLAMNPRHHRLVQLKFWVGATTEEIAAELGVSPSTVEKDWRFVRTWVYARLEGGR